MVEIIAKGTWVEIHNVVLKVGERSLNIPADTQQTALEMCVKGFLTTDAVLGEEAEIMTVASRKQYGKLIEVNPAYTHSFGAPIPELSDIGHQARALLSGEGTTDET